MATMALDVRRTFRPSPALKGAVGALALAAVYAAIVGGASGSLSHLRAQAAADWYYLAPLMAGFGVQVGLMSELRRRHRLMAATATAGIAGTSASTAGMIACCAHHIADLAPFIGASAAATFLTAYKVPFILVGLAINAIGIGVSVRQLRKLQT